MALLSICSILRRQNALSATLTVLMILAGGLSGAVAQGSIQSNENRPLKGFSFHAPSVAEPAVTLPDVSGATRPVRRSSAHQSQIEHDAIERERFIKGQQGSRKNQIELNRPRKLPWDQ